MTAHVGDQVLLVVPRHTNGGQDHIPAVVTRVSGDGKTVDVHAFRDSGQTVRGVALLESRAAVDKALAGHFVNLPGGSERENPDGSRDIVPGLNPQSGQPWNHSDTAHWHAYAYPAGPAGRAAAAEPPEAPRDVESADAKRARLLAELAELDATAAA